MIALKALLALVAVVFVAYVIIGTWPQLVKDTQNLRTDPQADAGLACATGAHTYCSVSLSSPSAYSGTNGMTVTETSPGSGDVTADTTVATDRETVTITDLAPATSYEFDIDYLKLNPDIPTPADGWLKAYPILGVLAVFGGVTFGAIALFSGRR